MPPRGPSEISCVAAIEAYVRAVRLRPEDPLIMRKGGQLTWGLFRWMLRQVAEAHGFDPNRLVVHSCRYGAVNQLVAATSGGARAYIMHSITRCNRTAAAIHDPALVPLDWLRHVLGAGKNGKKCRQ